ncbi:hypothetical protein LPJGGPFB_06572 [Ensifer adhaerens]|uniref:hypothetical protein n=1 Tax=Ensifer adhaerens TaxID=106592 RepID=UPI001569383E|nr:hypothetical protein [Ensifer adhaerens]NRP23302.1 hypothetical protein [Ensifer adhaerens]
MTNVSATPKKIATRAHLFEIAVRALEKEGWTVERVARSGKSSLRRIKKDKISKTVSIRTSQDTWIAFPRNSVDDGWATLSMVDFVVASTVDDRDNPRFAQVHLIDGDEMRERFDRAYRARRQAGYSMPVGRGIWLSLYDEEGTQPVTLVGAGAGLAYPPIAKELLSSPSGVDISADLDPEDVELEDAPLSISEAKRRLALTLGVDIDDISITIRG